MKREHFPTGCKCIDKLLGNGFESQLITLVYGESGTGKSILALQCAYKAALQGFITFYIDTESAFSPMRLKQISRDAFSSVGKKIFIHNPKRFHQQIKIIEKLEKFLTKNVKIIIIDTLSALFSAELSTNNSKKNYEMKKMLNHQMAELTRLSEQYNLAIIINNQVRTHISSENKEIVPINRNILDYWCPVHLFLMHPEKRNLNERLALLKKHFEKEINELCSFQISNEGCV